MECLIVKDSNNLEPLNENLESIEEINFDSIYSDGFNDSELCPSFGYSPKMFAPIFNTAASDFMTDNISEILHSIAKMGVDQSKIHDLYTDVYVSIREAEMDGRGFDDDYDISVRKFVFGRLKKYSLNKRYDPKYVENKNNGEYTLIAASYSGDDEDGLNGFQAAYKNAADLDDIDTLENALSIKDAIETCIDYLYNTSINVISFFRGVEGMMDLMSNRCKKSTNSVFCEISYIGNKHPELFEAMELALKFRASNKEIFFGVLTEIEKEEQRKLA